MDNLAHTLCGAALARARLVPPGPLTTATLVLAANGPDVDSIYYLLGDGAGAMLHRRGWTHSLLGVAVAIPLFAALMRAVGGRSSRGGAPPPWRPLLAASAVGYLSHLLLDLLNTYGVRFLVPFSERWFYGDTAFIVDPWMWLLFGAATLFGGEVRAWGWGLWVAFVAFGTWLMALRGVPAAALGAWPAAMLAAAVVRARRGPRTSVARAFVLVVALYLLGLKGISVNARARGLEHLAAELGDAALRDAPSTVNPEPAVPWRSTVVAETPDEILRVAVSLADPGAERVVFRMPRHLDDPALASVAGTREYRAWRHFARHPFVARAGRFLVLGDGRYSRGDAGDWCNLVLPIPDG